MKESQQKSDNSTISSSKQQYKNPKDPFLAIKQVYLKQINDWIKYLRQCHGKNIQIYSQSSKYYQLIFLPSVQKKIQLKIVLDNLVAKMMIQKLESLQFMRFSYVNMDKQIMQSYQYCQQQVWVYLLQIFTTLRQYKFINTSYFYKVVEKFTPQHSLEYRIMMYVKLMERKRQRQDEQQNYCISINQWRQIVRVDCREFWSDYIYKKPNLMAKSTVMKKLFKIFQEYLKNKLKQQDFNKLCKQLKIQNITEQKIKKSVIKKDILQQIAKQIWLFNDKAKVSQIKSQLKRFQQILRVQLFKKQEIHSIRYETYGSYRSKICLNSSDVDMTIFFQNQFGQESSQRPFIQKKIWQVYGILKMFQKLHNIQANIMYVSVVNNDRIKVPFIRIKFQSDMPLNQMDIVVNNRFGVENSKMLQIYAQNSTIRTVAILLKKWAKNQGLIDPKKLSSYGLTLMLLYYLMSVGELQFISPQLINKQTYSYNNKLRGKQNSWQIINNFLVFYGRQSSFYRQKQVACLVQNCSHDHQQMFNPQFIINIHDPFDHSNCGRMRTSNLYEFFHKFESIHSTLNQIKNLGQQQKKQQLKKIFGNNTRRRGYQNRRITQSDI